MLALWNIFPHFDCQLMFVRLFRAFSCAHRRRSAFAQCHWVRICGKYSHLGTLKVIGPPSADPWPGLNSVLTTHLRIFVANKGVHRWVGLQCQTQVADWWHLLFSRLKSSALLCSRFVAILFSFSFNHSVSVDCASRCFFCDQLLQRSHFNWLPSLNPARTQASKEGETWKSLRTGKFQQTLILCPGCQKTPQILFAF